MNNKIKKTQTILFASLIAALAIPLSGMGFAGADKAIKQKDIDDRFAQVSDLYSDATLAYVNGIISSDGEKQKSRTADNGLEVEETNNVTDLGENKYKVKTTVNVTDKSGESETSYVVYFVTEKRDGSLYVHVPDAKPSDKSTAKDHNGLEFIIKPEQMFPIPVADATVGTKKFIMEVTKIINNNFVDGSDTFAVNCGLYGTIASMYGAADATTIGNYWRSVSANVAGAWTYYDWCIIPNIYSGVDFEMGGSSYNDHQWEIGPTFPGWGATGGLQFPWDSLHWRTNVYYGI